MGDELSISEKAELLARHDRRNQGDYNEDLHKALLDLREPRIDDIEDKARRAILLYIRVLQDEMPDGDYPPGSYIMEGFMMGFLAGRYLKPDIFKKGKEPKVAA